LRLPIQGQQGSSLAASVARIELSGGTGAVHKNRGSAMIDKVEGISKNKFRNLNSWRPAVAYIAPSIEEYQAGTVVKHAPISTGTTTQRKRKPHILAVINEQCTGCSGSPACVEYCPVQDCMFWAPDEDHPPFGRIIVDPLLCIGCKLCTSKGPDGAFLEGCPWDAIDMVPLAEFEGDFGALPY
jgi:ferredoxin